MPGSLAGERGWKGRRGAGAGPGPGTAPIPAPAAGRGRGWTAALASAVCTGVRCPAGKPLAGPWRGRASRLSAGTAPRGARGPCARTLRPDPALGRRETQARPGPLRDARPDAPGSPLTASVSLLVPPPSPRGQPRLRAPCSLPLSVGANLRRPFPGLWPEAALQLAPWPWPWSLRLGSPTG